MLLENRTAIITGAGRESGIGFATARLFAAHGARTALVDLPDVDPAAIAARLGTGHHGYPCDVRDREQCRAVVERAVRDLGGLDILVNNAGVVQSQKIEDIGPGDWDTVLDVNLRGNFHMAQAAVPHLRRSPAGAIVCVSSIAGQRGGGVFGTAHYAAAKAGIMGLAKALARELAPHGIRANAIAPGAIDNDFTRGAMTPEIKEQVARGVPLGRLGTSDDVARVCLFLASDLSSYVTGTVIDVNGGLHIH